LKYADKIAEQSPAGSTENAKSATASEAIATAAKESSAPAPAASTWKFSGSGSTSAAVPTAAPTKASFGFNSAPKTTPADAAAPPAKPSFGFSSAPKAAAPTDANPSAPPAKPSFGFLSGAAKTAVAPAAAPSKPALGGFTGFKGFGSGAAAPASSTTAAGGDGEGGDEEGDDAMPELEPEEVLKNAADNDEIIHETACKLFRFHKPENPTDSSDKAEWKESGKGTLSLTKEPGASKKRVLIRNTLGKISVNAFVCKGMNFKKSGKNGIQFMAVNEKGALVAYMAKVKPESVDEAFQVLSKAEADA
jgi:hypothetical protein